MIIVYFQFPDQNLIFIEKGRDFGQVIVEKWLEWVDGLLINEVPFQYFFEEKFSFLD